MDLSAIYDPPEFVKVFHLAELEAIRENKNLTAILIKAFTGGHIGQQTSPVSLAVESLIVKYSRRGITIFFVDYTNDLVRNVLKMNCTETFTALLAADIHIVPTHFHQGMLTKGGTDTWNMENIIRNIARLRYHLGTPCGKKLDCPVWTQNKGLLYSCLEALELCLPTITLSIVDKTLSEEDEQRLDEFIFKISNDPRWARFKNENKFVAKLPYTTGSAHRRTVKPSMDGKPGILKCIQEFTNNERVLGYIDTVVIQPMAHFNKEASVILFGGKAQYRNPHKSGTIKKSVFNHAPDSVFFEFAENVVRKLQEICPQLIADQVLRVDFFGDLSETGELVFIVNEIEGYEAVQWGTGVNAISKTGSMNIKEQAYWEAEIETLIECHLELQRLRGSEKA